jgi:hypothetical protein
MTKEERERLMADQVFALAMVILTRRNDLSIAATKKDTGLDLHVYIKREDNPMRLVFGVLLRGMSDAVTPEQANKILKPTVAQFQGMRKFTYPVCVFLFTTREQQAFFSWLAEPVVNDGVPKLVHHEKANAVPLTNELLEQVIQQIVAWYDAVETVLIA